MHRSMVWWGFNSLHRAVRCNFQCAVWIRRSRVAMFCSTIIPGSCTDVICVWLAVNSCYLRIALPLTAPGPVEGFRVRDSAERAGFRWLDWAKRTCRAQWCTRPWRCCQRSFPGPPF